MSNDTKLYAPISGNVVKIETVKDEVFSQKVMGDGFAVEPTDGRIVSPVAGKITVQEGHALGFERADGLEVLLHLGIDTVSLKGAPFKINARVGDVVTGGQVLGTADWRQVEAAGFPKTTIVVITNTDEKLEDLQVRYGPTTAGTNIGEAKAGVPKARVPKAGAAVAGAAVAGAVAAPVAAVAAGPMSKSKYGPLAAAIIAGVGGPGNITKLIHCITRLRFTLVNKDLADKAALERLSGPDVPAITALYNANLNQYHVVIGQAVADVYDEVVYQLGDRVVDGEGTANAVAATAGATARNPVARAFQTVIGTITGSMMPVIGLLAAGGMINGLLNMFVKGNHIFEMIEPSNPTYVIISTLAMAPFYFLPVLVGFSAAKQLGADPLVVAAIGGFMIAPGLINLVAAPVVGFQNGAAVMGQSPVIAHLLGVTFNTTYFGIPVALPSYAYTIFPIIVAAALAKPVGNWLKNHMPLALRSIFVPMITFFVVGSIVLLLVGPVISLLSSGLSNIINFMLGLNLGIAGIIVGGFYQCLVIFGLHWLVVPIISQQIASAGESSLNMIVSFTMLAQGAGALAIAIKSRKADLKALAFPAAISAFCGVTEPAMYGINLKYMRVFIMSSIGAAVGAGIAGFFGLHMYGFSGSLIGFPNFAATTNPLTHAAGNPRNFIIFWIASAICMAVSMALVWLFGYNDHDVMTAGVKKVNPFKDAVAKK